MRLWQVAGAHIDLLGQLRVGKPSVFLQISQDVLIDSVEFGIVHMKDSFTLCRNIINISQIIDTYPIHSKFLPAYFEAPFMPFLLICDH